MSVDNTGNINIALGNNTGVYFNNTSTLIYGAFSNTSDIFLARYDANGNMLWAKSEGGAGSDYVFDIVTDNAQNSYITGWFLSDSIRFGSHTVVRLSNIPDAMYVVKYNASGVAQWAKTATGPGLAEAYMLKKDAQNNFYCIGNVSGTSVNIGGLVLNNPPTNSIDFFIAKFDTNGNFKWVTSNGGTGPDYVDDMKPGPDGYLYVTGEYRGPTITFGTSTLTKIGVADVFIAKLDQIPSPVVANVSNKCASEPTAFGKLLNPPANTYTISITMDGNPLTYQPVDSSFQYFNNGVTSLGSHAISVKYTRANVFAKTDTSYVVSSSAVPAVSISTASASICSGTATKFTATPSNGGTPVYQWQVNGVNAGTNSNTFTTSTLTNNAQVKVIMTSSLACASPVAATSNIIIMTITPFPTANAGNDVNICGGGSVQLQASGGTTYSWSPVAGLSNPNIANPVASPAATTTYTVTVSNGINCTANDAVAVSVGVPAVPVVNISTTNNNICAGSSATFTAVATNGGSNPAFQWQVNGVNAGTNSNTFTSASLTNNSQVKVILTSNSNCVTTPTATSNIITVQVAQLATPLVTANNQVLTVNNPDVGALYTWQLFNAGVWSDIIPIATGITYTAPAAGNYRVKEVKGGCTIYSAAATANIVSPTSHFIYLRPNPASKYIRIDSINLARHYETVEVVDVHGKRVLPILNISNKITVTIDIEMLPPGTYVAIIRTREDTHVALRFIKQ